MIGRQEVEDCEFDDSIREKTRRGNNSGYLENHYQVANQLPSLHDFFFRIQDEHQIIQLEQMQQQSRPFPMQQAFSNCSSGFQGRLDQLISQLDQHQVTLPNSHAPEPHGYYHLDEHYRDQSALESVLEKARVDELRAEVERLSIKELKPHFIKRGGNKEKMELEGGSLEVKKLGSKFGRMTITEQDC